MDRIQDFVDSFSETPTPVGPQLYWASRILAVGTGEPTVVLFVPAFAGGLPTVHVIGSDDEYLVDDFMWGPPVRVPGNPS